MLFICIYSICINIVFVFIGFVIYSMFILFICMKNHQIRPANALKLKRVTRAGLLIKSKHFKSKFQTSSKNFNYQNHISEALMKSFLYLSGKKCKK